MFWDADGPLRPNFEGLVARAIVETPEGSRRYRQRMGELFERVYRLETLTNRVEQLYRRNRPVVAELGRDAVRNYDYAVADLRERIVNRWSGIQRQLAAEPPELRFTNGLARVAGWQERDAGGNRLDRISESGKLLLHIGAAGNCTASWRVKVPVEAGRFRFQGLARTAHVAPLNDRQKGEGAGLRLSGTTRPRVNKLTGDAPWTKLEFEFEVPPEQHEVELICELRATKGEVWFDAESLELARLK